MHDIDRTQLETDWEYGEPEYGEPEYGEPEYGAYELDGEWDAYGELEGPMDEAEEMELAAELLEITDEAELDQFLGKLFKKIGRGVGKIIKSPVGRALGGIFKGIAKKVLPIAGGALGSLIPIPGVGTAVGTALGSAAGRMFGLELEGLSAEDQEFEVARRYVRLVSDAARQAAYAPATASPVQVAHTAVAAAARRHAPGLLAGGASGGPRPGMIGQRPGTVGRRGTWVRRGRVIILRGL